MPYELFCQSVIGHRHIQENMPKEDYGAVSETPIAKIFALGDGHGDKNCPRSCVGSEYVVKITIEKMRDFCESVHAAGLETDLFDAEKAEPLVRHLIRSIITSWSLAVNEHLSENPLTAEEEKGCDTYLSAYRAGKKLEHIYGTTLIAGVVTDRYMLLLQQGDGRCDVFWEDGSVTQPIPWDARCEGNICTSICQEDAIESCRYYICDITKTTVIACIAGSDGVEDSFPTMDGTHSYFRSLLAYACQNGVSALETYMETALDELNRDGSRDDTTVCGWIDMEKTSAFLPRFEKENQITHLREVLLTINDRLGSMQGKLQFLTTKRHAVMEAFSAAQAEEERVSASFVRVESAYRAAQSALAKAQADKDKMDAEYVPYVQRHNEFLERKRAIEEEIAALLTEAAEQPRTEKVSTETEGEVYEPDEIWTDGPNGSEAPNA